jgi:hypothetical protein
MRSRSRSRARSRGRSVTSVRSVRGPRDRSPVAVRSREEAHEEWARRERKSRRERDSLRQDNRNEESRIELARIALEYARGGRRQRLPNTPSPVRYSTAKVEREASRQGVDERRGASEHRVASERRGGASAPRGDTASRPQVPPVVDTSWASESGGDNWGNAGWDNNTRPAQAGYQRCPPQCNQWTANASCTYGNTCRFAHGSSDWAADAARRNSERAGGAKKEQQYHGYTCLRYEGGELQVLLEMKWGERHGWPRSKATEGSDEHGDWDESYDSLSGLIGQEAAAIVQTDSIQLSHPDTGLPLHEEWNWGPGKIHHSEMRIHTWLLNSSVTADIAKWEIKSGFEFVSLKEWANNINHGTTATTLLDMANAVEAAR